MSERIYDQAMHNKLLITNELANTIRCQPFESIIVTLGLYPIDQIAVNDQGFIINRKQEIVRLSISMMNIRNCFNYVKTILENRLRII